MKLKNIPYKTPGEGVDKTAPAPTPVPVATKEQPAQPAMTKHKSLWEQIPPWGWAVIVLAVVVMAVAAGAIIVAR